MWRLVLLLLITSFGYSQELSLTEETSMDVGSFVGVDMYKNTYTLKNDILYKKGALGQFQFSDIQLGTITSVDIINPLKLVLFYEAFNTVVFLDNKLSEIERINFLEVENLGLIQAVRNAGNNRLWLFNADSQQVEQYNYRTQQTIDISQPLSGVFKDFTSDFNYCHILTDEKLQTFNVKGGITFQMDNPPFDNITQHNESVIGYTANALFIKPENTTEFNTLKSPQINSQDVYLTQDFLYIYDRKILNTFALQQTKN